MPALRFVLGSASPARLATLRGAGLDPEVLVSGVDEEAVQEPTPAALAQRLADLKAAAVVAMLREREDAPTALVLGCDSVLDLDGRPLGKPASPAEAAARWQEMRGRSGVLHTGHALHDLPGGRTATGTSSTLVHFADLDDDEIAAYVATGEPLAVAGAFTVDGLGGGFVTGIEGDYHGVVGVSLPLLRDLVRGLGHRWTSLWAGP